MTGKQIAERMLQGLAYQSAFMRTAWLDYRFMENGFERFVQGELARALLALQ